MNHRAYVVLAALAAVSSSPALVARASCPDSFPAPEQLPEGQSMSCRCAPAQTGAGSVWGSDRYTADSSICHAAVHAGVIPEGGGKVTVYAAGGCPSFAGTSRHGVLSSSWGAFDRSFAFRPGVSCAGMEAVGSLPACPGTGTALAGHSAACALECYCPAGAMTGSVWGSDLYTAHFPICAAARHAGAVGASGGSVAAFPAGHCDAFKGSTRHEVTSAEWGPYDATFAFRYPPPACADGKAPRR